MAPTTADAVYASTGEKDVGTQVQLVPTSDLRGVDRAVNALMKDRILGIDWKGSVNEASRIRTVILSSGALTYVFDVVVRGELPAAIKLLLTHQDFAKVMYGGDDMESSLGKFFKEFGFLPREIFDVGDSISEKYGPESDLYDAFKRQFRKAKLSKGSFAKALSPDDDDLETGAQKRLYGFIAWATRSVFLKTEKPKGRPPYMTSTSSAIDINRIATLLTCQHCGERLESRAALKAHIRNQHEWPCKCCSFVATSESKLLDHMKLEHIYCDTCDEWMANAVELARHQKIYHNYMCPICNIRCTSAESLSEHMSKNHGQCGLCLQWFRDEDELGLHEETVHPKCTYCNAQFYGHNALFKHQYARINGVCVKIKETKRDSSSGSGASRHTKHVKEKECKSTSSKGGNVHMRTPSKQRVRVENLSEVILPAPRIFDQPWDPLRVVPGQSTHQQHEPGEDRWYEPPRTQVAPLYLSRTADSIGEIPD